MSGQHPKEERRQGGRRANDMSLKDLHDLQQKVVSHIHDTEIKFDRGENQFQEILAQLKTLSIAINTIEVSTKGIIQLHKDVEGAVRLGKGLQSFFLWCLKWGVIGTAAAFIINWLVDHPPNPPGNQP